jgi:flagellar FliL protein
VAIEEGVDDDEEVEEERGAGPSPKKGGNKVLLIVIIILLLALLGVGGFIMFGSKGDTKGGAPAKRVELEEVQDPLKLGEMVAFEPFIVNLAGEGGKRFLKVTMQVEMNKKKLAEEVNNKMPQMKDMIITVLASKTVDELLTIEGKFKLKEQLLTRINSNLKTGVVKNVYFVEFVIQ